MYCSARYPVDCGVLPGGGSANRLLVCGLCAAAAWRTLFAVHSSCTATALQSAFAVRATPLPHASAGLQVRMTTCEPACAAEIKAGLAQTGCCYTQARPEPPKGARAAVHWGTAVKGCILRAVARCYICGHWSGSKRCGTYHSEADWAHRRRLPLGTQITWRPCRLLPPPHAPLPLPREASKRVGSARRRGGGPAPCRCGAPRSTSRARRRSATRSTRSSLAFSRNRRRCSAPPLPVLPRRLIYDSRVTAASQPRYSRC